MHVARPCPERPAVMASGNLEAATKVTETRVCSTSRQNSLSSGRPSGPNLGRASQFVFLETSRTREETSRTPSFADRQGHVDGFVHVIALGFAAIASRLDGRASKNDDGIHPVPAPGLAIPELNPARGGYQRVVMNMIEKGELGQPGRHTTKG